MIFTAEIFPCINDAIWNDLDPPPPHFFQCADKECTLQSRVLVWSGYLEYIFGATS